MPGTLAARIALETPGNRSHELGHAEPKGAAVMLHGLSDAPYSLDAVGRLLHERGFHVVWLRLPGHGTHPGALRRVDWEDWMAATALALSHAASRAPGKPLYVAGYSTGAPLALLHVLRAIEDSVADDADAPPAVLPGDRRVRTSRRSPTSRRSSRLCPASRRRRGSTCMPEYDPYKYNSFPVNAGLQIWSLTRALEKAMAKAQAEGKLDRMPPVTAFQSLVDSTITAADLGNAAVRPSAGEGPRAGRVRREPQRRS